MILYLGFFIGRLSAPPEIRYLDPSQKPNGSWVQAWNKSKDLNIRAHLIIEGLWSDEEDKLVEIVFKDRGKELVFGFGLYVPAKPGSVYDIDIGYLITTWEEPTEHAELIVRIISDRNYSYNCGYSRYWFKFKPRPKTDEELNNEPLKDRE